MNSQRNIIFPDEKTLCVLADMCGARERLPGHDEDEIMALVEFDDMLPWTWNIALNPSRDVMSAEIRFLAPGLDYYRTTGKPAQWTFDQVMDCIFRGLTNTIISGRQTRLILNCSPSHISNLLTAGELAPVAGTTWGTGPKGSAQITRDSLRDFFMRRQWIKDSQFANI